MSIAGPVAVYGVHLEPGDMLLAMAITDPATLRAIAHNREAVVGQARRQCGQGLGQRGEAGKALCFRAIAGPQVQARQQGVEQLRVDIGQLRAGVEGQVHAGRQAQYPVQQ